MTTQGLSIVIPQYSQEVVSLLDRLETCIPNHLVYEFIVANDNDNASYPQTKEWLTKRGFHYLQNPKNIGRAKNRNQLAKASQYDLLLFIDEDMIPKNSVFIERYLNALDESDVVVGGHIYEENSPKSPYRLHWKYGSTIEAKASSNAANRSFSSAVFGIKKSCFQSVSFESSIQDYGHEDSLFGASLDQYNYTIQFIDEPCYHLGLHSNTTFVSRSHTAIQTLYQIETTIDNPASHKLTRLQRTYATRKRSISGRIVLQGIRTGRPLWKWMAIQWSSVPALQLYKLSCYCHLKQMR